MGRGVGGAAPSINVIGIPPLSAKFEVVEWRRRGRGMGGGLKSHIENSGEEIMWREGWTGEGRLKSQIENAEEERMGKDGWREREWIEIADTQMRMGLGEAVGYGREDSNRILKTHGRNG